MKVCHWCAEQIQDEARVCRFCGRSPAAPAASPADAPPTIPPDRYDTPIRVEQQTSAGAQGAGAGARATATTIAFKGSVCPKCLAGDYVNTFSVWHGVLAICLFPLGLLGLFLPIKRCVGCGHRYGAGRVVTMVMGILALLFAVVVLLGVLLAMAPKVANTKDRAYTASMKSDLRNLVTAQEAYFSDHQSAYAPSVDALGTGYHASSGVTVIIGRVAPTGWSATATHQSTDKTCRIQVGIEPNDINNAEPVCR